MNTPRIVEVEAILPMGRKIASAWTNEWIISRKYGKIEASMKWMDELKQHDNINNFCSYNN